MGLGFEREFPPGLAGGKTVVEARGDVRHRLQVRGCRVQGAGCRVQGAGCRVHIGGGGSPAWARASTPSCSAPRPRPRRPAPEREAQRQVMQARGIETGYARERERDRV